MLNAALIAISVFPNPTSPQTSLSIGLPEHKSLLIWLIVLIWSEVSVNSNCEENFSYSNELKWIISPLSKALFAATFIKSFAISLILFLILAFFFCQLLNPSLSNDTLSSDSPYLDINSRFWIGINNLSLE